LEVKAYSYSYHAWREGSEAGVLRYDSAHGLDELHRHFFDAKGEEIEIRFIPLGDLPTLAGVIEEAVELATEFSEKAFRPQAA
jgi:hypothetical protein